MDETLCLEAEFCLPPTANTLFQTALRKNKRWTFLSNEGRTFRNHVVETLKGVEFEKISNFYRIAVDIEFIFSTNRRQDVDNRIKGLFDSLTVAQVWEDDSQVFKLKVNKIVDKMAESKTKIKVYKYIN